MHAAQLAGLTTIPAIVRELSDDDAVIAMVDANIQREELLPSEKAFAYKMKMDAMRRTAGVRTKIIPDKMSGIMRRQISLERIMEKVDDRFKDIFVLRN